MYCCSLSVLDSSIVFIVHTFFCFWILLYSFWCEQCQSIFDTIEHGYTDMILLLLLCFDAYFVDSNVMLFSFFFFFVFLLLLAKWKCYRHRLLCTIFPWSIFNDSWRDWILWRIYDGTFSLFHFVYIFVIVVFILLVVPSHRIPTSITNL